MTLSSLFLIGCARHIGDMDCRDAEREAIGLSKGSLIKIVEAVETSRNTSDFVCHGIGYYRDGEQVPTRYRVWQDEEGEIMIVWDTKEAADADWARTVAQAQRENDAADRKTNDDIDRAFANLPDN